MSNSEKNKIEKYNFNNDKHSFWQSYFLILFLTVNVDYDIIMAYLLYFYKKKIKFSILLIFFQPSQLSHHLVV